MSYICPVCKKEYATIVEVAKCLSECAEKDKQSKIEALDKKVKEAYAEVKKAVNEYNKVNADDKVYSCNLISHNVKGKQYAKEVGDSLKELVKNSYDIKKNPEPQSCGDPIGYFSKKPSEKINASKEGENKIKNGKIKESSDIFDTEILIDLINDLLK